MTLAALRASSPPCSSMSRSSVGRTTTRVLLLLIALSHWQPLPANCSAFIRDTMDVGHIDVGHNDVGHIDVDHIDVDHIDVGHNDVGHIDVDHNDVGNIDVDHNDVGHIDVDHNDVGHIDVDHNDGGHTAQEEEDNGGEADGAEHASGGRRGEALRDVGDATWEEEEEQQGGDEGAGQAGSMLGEALWSYLNELYQRMVRADQAEGGGVGEADHRRASRERIVAFNQHTSSNHPHDLIFDISLLKPDDNVTMALVAVVTTSNRAACHPRLRESHHNYTKLHCETRPFRIRNLATVDVTSLLTSQLGQRLFHVYAQRRRSVRKAMLIVFNIINTDLMLSGSTPLRLREPAYRQKRAANRQSSVDNKARTNRRKPSARWMSYVEGRGNDLPREGKIHTTPSKLDVNGAQRFEVVADRHEESEGHPLSEDLKAITRRKNLSFKMTANIPTDNNGTIHSSIEHRGHHSDSFALDNENSYGSGPSVMNAAKSRRTSRGALEAPSPTRRQSWTFQQRASELRDQLQERLKRSVRKRSAGGSSISANEAGALTLGPDVCQVRELEVSATEELGMYDIISPVLMNIGQCGGSCPPYLVPSTGLPYHSHLLSRMHYLHHRTTNRYSPPSCRPTSYDHFVVMRYLEDTDNIVLERWHGGRVTACGCR